MNCLYRISKVATVGLIIWPSLFAPTIGQEKPPYEDRLHRVAELAGSMHYLSNLCKTSQNNSFRLRMQEIIDAETASEPARRKQLIAKYNMGYRAFSSVYTICTDAARLIEGNYRKEGQKLINELLTRYSN
jgi:uncharacterized protein (TIGR02301 family)